MSSPVGEVAPLLDVRAAVGHALLMVSVGAANGSADPDHDPVRGFISVLGEAGYRIVPLTDSYRGLATK